MESVVALLVMAAMLEICHQWKQFRIPVLPWISFGMVMVALLRAVRVGMEPDGILIVLLVWFAIKLLPYWSRGNEL